MAVEAKRAAFFDVDNTLIRGSTIYFLGRGMYQRGYFTKSDISRFVLANLRFRLTGTEKREEIEKFQNAATSFIGGHNVQDIQNLAQEIYDEYGVEVWLVTAAPEDMATLIAKRLGFTGALGSKAAIADGIYTGEMNGPLLHGREKAIAVKKIAGERGFDLSQCFAYSDSYNDLPLLETVGQPSTINPDAKLRIWATRERWPIHDFRRARKINRFLGPAISRLASIGALIGPRGHRR
jgi:HAD superfamily hydrolase (TIGR01490 family)